MYKKLLAIAMIGTALTASAKVDMQFRDGAVTSPDFGGHFMTYYDEATGVMTAKSIHAGTTYEEFLTYCHEYANDANKDNLKVEPWLTAGGGMDENGFWADNVANMPAGPRYLRTKKPAEGTWESNGYTAEHKFLSFAYKTNTPSASITIFWQESSAVTPVEVPMTVSEEWQTALINVAPPAEWCTMENGYLWLVFNSWQDSQNEIILEVKDLAWLTPDEAGIEPEPPVPGTEPGELTAPVPFVFSSLGAFQPDINSWDQPFYWLKDGFAGNALLSQKFVATIPATASILEFDYKLSEPIGRFIIYVMQTAESNPSPAIPNAGGPGIGGTPIAILAPFPATDYSLIEVADEGWVHVEVNLITHKNTIGDVESDKMAGVAKSNFVNAKFAQKAGSGDYIQIQADGLVSESEFYLKNFQLVDDPAGIEGVAADEASEVVSSEYFDLQGRQLNAAPETGLYLRRDIRANGTANTVKVVR